MTYQILELFEQLKTICAESITKLEEEPLINVRIIGKGPCWLQQDQTGKMTPYRSENTQTTSPSIDKLVNKPWITVPAILFGQKVNTTDADLNNDHLLIGLGSNNSIYHNTLNVGDTTQVAVLFKIKIDDLRFSNNDSIAYSIDKSIIPLIKKLSSCERNELLSHLTFEIFSHLLHLQTHYITVNEQRVLRFRLKDFEFKSQ